MAAPVWSLSQSTVGTKQVAVDRCIPFLDQANGAILVLVFAEPKKPTSLPCTGNERVYGDGAMAMGAND